MQIIDPKVNSNAHLPAHAPREYARKKLIEDFPSLHGKRSFLNLEAMQQRSVRVSSYNGFYYTKQFFFNFRIHNQLLLANI